MISPETISSQSLNKELAYLLGVYLTDGSVVSNGCNGFQFTMKVVDEPFAKQTMDFLKIIIPSCKANISKTEGRTRFGNDGQVSSCRDQYCVEVGFSKWGQWFKDQTAEKHSLPLVIWEAPLPIKKWFIAGVMDGDGYITHHIRNTDRSLQTKIGVAKSYGGWIHDFKKLVQQLGVSVNKEEIRSNGGVPLVSFRMRPDTFVSAGLFFTMPRKQDRLLRFIQERSETKRHPPYGVKI